MPIRLGERVVNTERASLSTLCLIGPSSRAALADESRMREQVLMPATWCSTKRRKCSSQISFTAEKAHADTMSASFQHAYCWKSCRRQANGDLAEVEGNRAFARFFSDQGQALIPTTPRHRGQ